MSQTMKINVPHKTLQRFLADEYRKDTGVPVHLFSVVNATFSWYNKNLGMTNGTGTMFFEGPYLKSYGCSDNTSMIRALNRCGVRFKWVD